MITVPVSKEPQAHTQKWKCFLNEGNELDMLTKVQKTKDRFDRQKRER